MTSNRIELLTPLRPAECAWRLTAVIDTEWSALFSFAGLFGSRPVVGRVTESSLRLRKRIGYRNSFQNHLTATMRPEGGGTLISGDVAMHPFVRVFMFVWFSGVVVIGGMMFLAAVSSLLFGGGNQYQNAWLGAIIPPAMLAFGYGLVRFSRYLARGETRFLIEFLVHTLDAYEKDRAG